MSMDSIAKPWIKDLLSYEPGRPMEELARELGLDSADDIIKMASNENALGPSPRAIQAMKDAAAHMHLYPDGGAFHLRHALAKKLGVEAHQIILGSGSNELIVFLGHVFLKKGRNIVMADRAFIVYSLVASAHEADTKRVPMKDFTHDLDAMADAIDRNTAIVFISNPNNPTGTMVDAETIARFMDRVPDHVVVVFDEAYTELLPADKRPDTLRYVSEGRNVYILRTFSKAHGLAGLRVGYAIASKEAVKLLHRVRQPFNLNAMAQAAALAALDDEEHVEKTRQMIAAGLAYLAGAFDELGLSHVPSVTNFMLVKVGQGREVFQALQQRHVIVRPMNAYRMPEYIRVTVGTQEQNETFVRALAAVMQETGTDI